jgi:hypothetical protein
MATSVSTVAAINDVRKAVFMPGHSSTFQLNAIISLLVFASFGRVGRSVEASARVRTAATTPARWAARWLACTRTAS